MEHPVIYTWLVTLTVLIVLVALRTMLTFVDIADFITAQGKINKGVIAVLKKEADHEQD